MRNLNRRHTEALEKIAQAEERIAAAEETIAQYLGEFLRGDDAVESKLVATTKKGIPRKNPPPKK